MSPRKLRPQRPLWQRLLPGVVVMRDYQRGWLKGDVIAGITVAAYLVPQVMAASRRRSVGGPRADGCLFFPGHLSEDVDWPGIHHGIDVCCGD